MNGVMILPQIKRTDNWKTERRVGISRPGDERKNGPPGEAGLR
jgi:hypothetical protein